MFRFTQSLLFTLVGILLLSTVFSGSLSAEKDPTPTDDSIGCDELGPFQQVEVSKFEFPSISDGDQEYCNQDSDMDLGCSDIDSDPSMDPDFVGPVIVNEIANNNKIYNSLILCTTGSADPQCKHHWQDLNCLGCGNQSCEETPDGNLNGSQAICPSTGNPPSYEWQYRNASNNWVWENAPGTFWEDDYNPPTTSESTWYRRRTLCAGCTNWTETGEVVDVHIQTPLSSAGTINNDYCGTFPYTITTGQIQGMASDNLTQFIEFEWRRNCDGGGWETVTNQNFLDANDNSLISYTVTTSAMSGKTTCLYQKRLRVHGCDNWVETPSITISNPDGCCTFPDVTNDSYSSCPGNNISGNLSTNDGSLTNPTYALQSGGTASSNGSINVNSSGTFTYDPSGSPCGNYSFTYRVCNNNDSSCCSDATASLSYSDTTDPVLSGVPSNATVSCNSVPSASSPSASDNCDSSVSIAFSETTSNTICTDSYTITRRWTATDNCGNTDVDTQVITVRDTTDPVLSGIPSNVTVQCNSIPAVASPSASDNCDGSVSISMNQTTSNTTCTDSYTITRTWTATDNCGNTDVESQVITVRDTTDPVLSNVPANVTIGCGSVPAAPTLSATDNCDDNVVVTMNETTAAGACADVYTITRTWTATDNCGNTDVDSQVITVQDAPDPAGVNAQICGSGAVSLGASSSSCVSCDEMRWYSSLTGGSVINTGLTYAPSISSTTSYYLSCYNSAADCESTPRQQVTGTINPIPSMMANATCSSDGLTYSITVTTVDASGLMSDQGTVSGTAPNFTVSGVLTGTNTVLVAMDFATTCSDTETVTSPTCACPAGSPTVGGAERCGSGSVTLTATSGVNCNEIRWYNTLTGGAVVNTGTTYTTSITGTTSYFVACYNSANLCESDPRQQVVATMNVVPTYTIAASQGTCTGTTANNDAVITLTSVVGDEASIMAGATYVPGPDYGNASNEDVSSGSGSFTGLMHATEYTLRVWNGVSDCFEDKTITTPSINCTVACTNPAYATATAEGSCNGTSANNDATISLSSVTNGEEASVSVGSTYSGAAYGAGANIDVSGGSGSLTGLTHATVYTVRVWNGADDCFVDETITTPSINCAPLGDCDCTEYIYLNEPLISSVLKFEVGSDLLLTEVIGANGGTPPTEHWYPGTGVSELDNPHGLASDLNGNLYIAESPWSGSIRQFDCDGTLSPEGATTVDDIDGGMFNVFSIGNIIYGTTYGGLTSYNSCTGEKLESLCYNRSDGTQQSDDTTNWTWGLSYNEVTEMVYATVRYTDSQAVYVYSKDELEAALSSGVCIDPLIPIGTSSTISIGDNYLPNNMSSLMGLVSDNDGNIYVVGVVGGFGIIFKYDSSGAFLGMSAPTSNAISTQGIVLSAEFDRLYLSNYSDNLSVDCISAFDTDLNYIGTAAANPGLVADNTAKALVLVKECCPVGLAESIQKDVCGTSGDKFYLNEEAFSECDGIVCGSDWGLQGALPAGWVYDDCDNSVVVAGEGCATFSLDIGAVISTGCSAQSSSFTICFDLPEVTLSTSVGTCTGVNPNDDATINLSAVTNGDQASVSVGSTYSGAAYGAGANIDVSTGSGSFTGLTHATTYTVRVWNGAEDCYADETITTPSIDCEMPCSDPNCFTITPVKNN